MKTFKKIKFSRELFFIISSLLIGCNENDVALKSGTIYGIVTDAVSGEPLRGVGITVTPGGYTSVTGNEGQYEFQDIEEGTYSVQFEKTGHITNSRQVIVVAGKTARGDCLLTQEIIGMTLDVSELNFGTMHNSLVFKIENTNISKPVSWQASNIPTYLTLSSSSGTIGIGKSASVVVQLSRNLITENTSSHIILSSEGGSISILISVNLAVEASVRTLSATNITSSSAQIEGRILADGTPPITERGFCYSTDRFPTINNSRIPVTGIGAGSYSTTLTGLSGGTMYSIRAYAINEIGVAYGDEIWFETPSSAKVSVDDYLAISDGLYFYFSPSSDTKSYYWTRYNTDRLPDDDKIIRDILSEGVEMDMNDSHKGYAYDLNEETKHTLCILAFDVANKQGELVKKEFTTKSSKNQPIVNIKINSILDNKVYFDFTKNSNCSFYFYNSFWNLDESDMELPDIVWAAYCYDDYKAGYVSEKNNCTNVSLSLTPNSDFYAISTFGFNSKSENSGVVSKQFFSTESKSVINRSVMLKTGYSESKNCKMVNKKRMREAQVLK